tara:strand:- start:61 stop:384 length:324 start_codon:yes stop_codon:yes gene_type:complete
MANTTIIYEALKAHFEAQRKKSVATLSVYFNNAAGIGEHPQIIDEMVEQTKLLAEANDCLDTLLNTFEDPTEQENETQETLQKLQDAIGEIRDINIDPDSDNENEQQ